MSAAMAGLAGFNLQRTIAADVTWQVPVNVSVDTDVSTAGSLQYAVSFGASPSVNGVSFVNVGTSGNSDVAFTASGPYGSGSSNAPFTNLPGDYQTLLGTAVYGTSPISLNNLFTGLDYNIQIWANDSRTYPGTAPMSVTGGNGTTNLQVNSTGTDGGVGQYAIGSFTADGTQSETLTLGAWVSPNALQVRATGVSAGNTADITVQTTWSGAMTVGSGASFLTDAPSGSNTQTFTNQITLSGGNLSTSGATPAQNVREEGSFSYGNFYFPAGGSIYATGNATSTISGDIGVNGNDLGGYTPISVDGGSTLNITGNLSGVAYVSWGGISKYGNGTLNLIGSAVHVSQGMVLEAGTVQFGNGTLPVNLRAGGAPGGYGADFEGNATLKWASGNNQDISSGAGASQIKIDDGVTATFDTNGNNVTLGTAFDTGGSGTGAVAKAGPGTLTLTAANAYSGGTTIHGGTLSAVGTALGTGPVTIAGGTIAVNDGATTIAQTLTTADQTWKANSGYTARIFNDGSSDQLQITAGSSSLTIDPSVSTATPFTVTAGTTTLGSLDPTVSEDWVIASDITTLYGVTAPSIGNPTVLATAGAGASSAGFVLNVPSNLFSGPEASAPRLELEASGGGQYSMDVVYVAAPEPCTAVLGLSAIVPMLLLRRRKRNLGEQG